jgi:hypothetical protein
MTKTTFKKVTPRKGSNQTQWNVDSDGKPFGAIWTFRNTRTETFPFTAKPLDAEHAHFGTLAEAKDFMEAVS